MVKASDKRSTVGFCNNITGSTGRCKRRCKRSAKRSAWMESSPRSGKLVADNTSGVVFKYSAQVFRMVSPSVSCGSGLTGKGFGLVSTGAGLVSGFGSVLTGAAESVWLINNLCKPLKRWHPGFPIVLPRGVPCLTQTEPSIVKHINCSLTESTARESRATGCKHHCHNE